jgi:leader peptidase (prepilin peptidase) / N-methyltransferase
MIAFVFGACVGSFVNVVAYRLPREISIVRPRSFCPECGHPIPVWANIPIVAYIALRGRCLMCGKPIPFRHLLGEFAMAVCALYVYLSFPFPDAVARFVFCSTLLVCALIDYDWRLIPNVVSIPGIPIGFLFAWLAMPDIGWKSSLVGIALGVGFLFITGELYLLLRGQEGVGMGDVYLLGMIGAFTGWIGVLFTLFVGSILGAIGGIAASLTGGEAPGGASAAATTAETSAPPPGTTPEPAAEQPVEGEPAEREPSILRTEVPFGPFLALAAAIFTLFQPQLAYWYLSH